MTCSAVRALRLPLRASAVVSNAEPTRLPIERQPYPAIEALNFTAEAQSPRRKTQRTMGSGLAIHRMTAIGKRSD